MDTFDYDKEFSEWVYIREQTETALISSSPATSTYSLPPSPSHVPGTTKDLSTSSNVNGDIIFSLPEHIILTVFRYGCTDPYSLYRYVSWPWLHISSDPLYHVFASLAPNLPKSCIRPPFLRASGFQASIARFQKHIH